jgi:hypothetical protein
LISGSPTAQAGNQLFTGSWTVKAMGNELYGGFDSTEFYSAIGMPQGIQCNPAQPRCPFTSTPTSGMGYWAPLGGSPNYALYCQNLATYGTGVTVRPAKGATVTTGMGRRIAPLYRNPGFFTSAGQPGYFSCNATSTDGYSGRGLVQVGQPITGTGLANTTGIPGKGGFNFVAAPATGTAGVRATGVIGELPFPPFSILSDYLYNYTYATLRNDAGVFGPSGGPGSFSLYDPAPSAALITVKQGAAKFGGTMRMLGSLTSKHCYFYAGCYLAEPDRRYDAIGASAYYTLMGIVSQGYVVNETFYSYNPTQMNRTTIFMEGSRFPWTTGDVTVVALGYVHDTIHYAHGYDNRNTMTSNGLGTVQLVSPVLTRWIEAGWTNQTAGIAILRIQFVGTGPDLDADGVQDSSDNCSESPNPTQTDTDGDDCGNRCDGDYDQNGITGWSDHGDFMQCWGNTNQLCEHAEPPNGHVGFPDWVVFLGDLLGNVPGPSGTTAGTTACP